MQIKRCIKECGAKVPEVDRVFIGLRTVSDKLVKCACIGRNFGKIIGMVPSDVPNSDGYDSKSPERRENGAFVYKVYRK